MTGAVRQLLKDVTLPVRSHNPSRQLAQAFTYVDLSSVDQQLKTILGPRVVQSKDAPSRARQLLRTGDVLVSTVRPNLNAVAQVPDEYHGSTASTGFSVLRPSQKLDSAYLFHWVRSDEFVADLVRKATGASYPAVSDAIVKSQFIPRPPIEEQRRIAEILDRADALRAKRREALAHLDTLTQSIFLDMFGDVLNNSRSWPAGSVSDLVAGFVSGKNLVAEDSFDQTADFRVLRVSAVTLLRFRPDESKALPRSYVPPAHHFVRRGELLFSRANTIELIGATAFVDTDARNLVLPDKLWRFEWHADQPASPEFVCQLFRQASFREAIRRRASGTSGSMQNISQRSVLSIPVGLPPVAMQQEFATVSRGIAVYERHVTHGLKMTNSLVASLQHRAFGGEL